MVPIFVPAKKTLQYITASFDEASVTCPLIEVVWACATEINNIKVIKILTNVLSIISGYDFSC